MVLQEQELQAVQEVAVVLLMVVAHLQAVLAILLLHHQVKVTQEEMVLMRLHLLEVVAEVHQQLVAMLQAHKVEQEEQELQIQYQVHP
jgi:hypothetical protein